MGGSDPPAVEAAFNSFVVAQSVLVAALLLILPIDVWGFGEFLAKQFRNTSRGDVVMSRLRGSLTASLLVMCVSESIVLHSAVATGVDPEACHIEAKLIACLYITGCCFAYIFLLQKVKLVSRFARERTFTRLLWATEVSLMVCIPGAVILYACTTQGALTPQGRCLQTAPAWVIWAFSIANLGLSAVLIYLFAKPLREMRKSGIIALQRDLTRVYWRNVLISSLAVVYTSVTVVAYGVLHFLYDLSEKEKGDREDLVVLGLMVMSWDGLVLVVCCRLTTFVWLPARVQQCVPGGHKSSARSMASSRPHAPPLPPEVDEGEGRGGV